MTLYLCDHCKAEKPIGDFYPYAKRKCKACFKAYRQWWEKEFPDKVAAKSKRRWIKHKDRYLIRGRANGRTNKKTDKQRETIKQWRKTHPVEWNVKARVRYAVLTGKLFRPDSCGKCGYAGHKPQAHHEDYAKPLDVQWLCASCHKRRHKEMDALGIAPLNGTPCQ